MINRLLCLCFVLNFYLLSEVSSSTPLWVRVCLGDEIKFRCSIAALSHTWSSKHFPDLQIGSSDPIYSVYMQHNLTLQRVSYSENRIETTLRMTAKRKHGNTAITCRNGELVQSFIVKLLAAPSSPSLTVLQAVDDQSIAFKIKRPRISSGCITKYLIKSKTTNRIKGNLSDTMSVLPGDRHGHKPVVSTVRGYNLCRYTYSFTATPATSGGLGTRSRAVGFDFIERTVITSTELGISFQIVVSRHPGCSNLHIHGTVSTHTKVISNKTANYGNITIDFRLGPRKKALNFSCTVAVFGQHGPIETKSFHCSLVKSHFRNYSGSLSQIVIALSVLLLIGAPLTAFVVTGVAPSVIRRVKAKKNRIPRQKSKRHDFNFLSGFLGLHSKAKAVQKSESGHSTGMETAVGPPMDTGMAPSRSVAWEDQPLPGGGLAWWERDGGQGKKEGAVKKSQPTAAAGRQGQQRERVLPNLQPPAIARHDRQAGLVSPSVARQDHDQSVAGYDQRKLIPTSIAGHDQHELSPESSIEATSSDDSYSFEFLIERY